MKFELYGLGRKLDVEVGIEGEEFIVQFEGKRFSVRFPGAPSGDSLLAVVDGKELTVTLEDETESALRICIDGHSASLGRAQAAVMSGSQEAEDAAPAAEANAVASPLFGKVISVDVRVGDSVEPGQSLVVLEAMKMESVLRADGKHRVSQVLVKEGDGVTKGQVLLRFS